MRIPVVLLCGLVLMICLIIMRLSPGSHSHLSSAQSVQGNDHPVVVKDKLTLENPTETQIEAPGWEERFWTIARQPVWLQSQEELETLADGIPEDRIPATLKELSNDTSEATLIFSRQLVLRWAEKSPAEAARWIVSLPDTAFGHSAFKEVVVPWATTDLAGAVAWVQNLPDNGNKVAAEWSLANEAAAQKQASTALTLVANLPSSPERDDLLNYSVRQWSTVDPDAAVGWIGQVADPALREQMLKNVAVDMGRENSAGAAAFVADMLPPGEGQDQAAIDVVRFWAASAPAQAADWLEQFPEGDLRDLATANLMDVWGKDDPGAANAWMTTVQ